MVFDPDPSQLSYTILSYNIYKAGYTATPVACGWAEAIIKVSGAFGQEQ